jgi:DNA-binding MarR family transcriptional regulator
MLVTDTALRSAGASAEVSPEVVAVTNTFVALVRSFSRARARWLAAAVHDVEWSAHIILKCVANDGPMRASAVAECLHSDPSTVSRQVGALVKDGLLERRADPVDGRASLLVTTPQAAEVLAEHDRIKMQHFARMLSGWDDADLRQFSDLLARFTADFEAANNDVPANRLLSSATQHHPDPQQQGRNG